MEEIPDPSTPFQPERPLECGECRRPIAVHYTEIDENACSYTGMCNECPELQRRLRGGHSDQSTLAHQRGITDLVCGECGTTLDSFLVSRQLGCSQCYEVFADTIVDELLKSNKISPRMTKGKFSGPLHLGRSRGETFEINPSLQLIALNETLKETLLREDYEQAAWLRDQIKAITDGAGEKHDPQT